MKSLILLAATIAALHLWAWWVGRRVDRWLRAVPAHE